MTIPSAPEHHRMMTQFAELLAQAPAGSRLELGVCHGESLKVMAQHDGVTFGVDSFEGMGDPGPHDITPEGINQYPRGRLRAEMLDVARRLRGVGHIQLIKGWVPQILKHELLEHEKFAFVHIDMDHYEPTVLAIAWAWYRMLPGGIICCDDWFPQRTSMFAARAIKEAVDAYRPLDGEITRKAFWRF